MDELDSIFAALADPTRRAILARLASGEASVGELGRPFAISQPAVTKHLKVLESAGLVSRSRAGRRRPARLEPERLGRAAEWMEHYRAVWEGRCERLDQYLEIMKTEEDRDDPAGG